MIRAVFFDVDFTLIHPGPTFQGDGYAAFCAAEGLRLQTQRFDDAVAAASGILDEVEEQVYDPNLFVHYTATIIEHMRDDGDPGAVRAGAAPRHPGVRRAAERIYAEWATNHHFEMYDDVEPVLTGLAQQGLLLGAISNSHRCLHAFKTHFKLDALIGATITSAEHGYMKPHRSIFDQALQRASVSAAEAMMVGDSLRADIEGAVAAGMKGVLLRRSGEQPASLPDGVQVIRSLYDLPALIASR